MGGGPMASVSHSRRITLAQISFALFVVVIPLLAGIGWAEHQRTSDLQRVTREARLHAIFDDWQLYDAQIRSCERVNTIRNRQNAIVSWIVQHDVTFLLRSQPIVICTDVIPEPTEPRPPKGATDIKPGG